MPENTLARLGLSLLCGAVIVTGIFAWDHDKTCPKNPINQTSFSSSGKWIFSKTYISNDEHRKNTKILVTTSFGSPVELYNYKFETDCVSGNSVQTDEFILICGTYQLQFLVKEHSNEQ